MFGQVPKMAWENSVVTDRKNRMTLGLNCLLLQVCGRNVLIDTGVGSKDVDNDKESLGLVPSRLLKGPQGHGANSQRHSCSSSYSSSFRPQRRLHQAGPRRQYCPHFPQGAATTYSGTCWEEACNPNERCYATHREDNFLPIEERGQLELCWTATPRFSPAST